MVPLRRPQASWPADVSHSICAWHHCACVQPLGQTRELRPAFDLSLTIDDHLASISAVYVTRSMTAHGSILIADDAPDFLVVTARLLRSQGYDCDCVPDAHGAAEKLQTEEYDLLISDIEMPGNQDMALIRNVPQMAAGLPVILITGHPTIQTATQSFQLSVVAYLIKPVEPQELIDSVTQAIERSRACRAIAQSRRRLGNSVKELEQLENLMRNEQRGSGSPLWDVFPSLALVQIAGSLRDLERYTEALAHKKGASVEHAISLTPVELLYAVRETIAVLERTKSAFKSRELGDLRLRLESLVAQAAKQSRIGLQKT